MEPDLIVSCPYNPAHRIRKYKLMSHIVKCKKSCKTENKVECPLDKSHIINQKDLREHIASCSSLGKLINMDTAYIKQETNSLSSIIEPYKETENWEEEPEAPSYDPMEVSAKRQVMRCLPGLSKSERKKFRDNERMRIANLQGVNITRTDLSLVKDTVHEVPLRPPHNTSIETLYDTKITQDDFDKNICVHNDNTSTQAKPSHKFDRSLFHKKLYDETASKCDDVSQQLEQSIHSTDMGACSREYFQFISREKENLPISEHQEQKTKVKTETNSSFEMFSFDNLGKEKSKRSVGTSAPERVTDKLLALLKNHSDVKKVEPVEETKDIDQYNEESGERGFTWEENFSKFNDRLAYLTDIQNAAAEESALLLKQLKELKLRRDTAPRK